MATGFFATFGFGVGFFLTTFLILFTFFVTTTLLEGSMSCLSTADNGAFPPIDSNKWETIQLEELEWNSTAQQPLYDFLNETNTDAFLILKNGRIVLEKYFGDFKKSYYLCTRFVKSEFIFEIKWLCSSTG